MSVGCYFYSGILEMLYLVNFGLLSVGVGCVPFSLYSGVDCRGF